MLFSYEALDKNGGKQSGTIETVSRDVAISSLQRRGFSITSVEAVDDKKNVLNISFFEGVSNKEVVLLSRQIATLFEAQVSALRIFRLLASEAEKPLLQRVLTEVADDIQSGSPISRALGKHPKVFSPF